MTIHKGKQLLYQPRTGETIQWMVFKPGINVVSPCFALTFGSGQMGAALHFRATVSPTCGWELYLRPPFLGPSVILTPVTMPEKAATPWERIEQIMREKGFTSCTAFARRVGIKSAENLYQIKRGNNRISENLVSIITKAFPDVDPYFLMTGRQSVEALKIPLYITDPVSRFRAGVPPDNYITVPYQWGVELSFATVNNEPEAICGATANSIVMLEEVCRDGFALGKAHLIESASRLMLRYIGDDPHTGHYRLWKEPSGSPRVRIITGEEIISLFAVRYVLNVY